jgi:hypothetical protein
VHAWNGKEHWNLFFVEKKQDVGPARGGGRAREQRRALLAGQVPVVCGGDYTLPMTLMQRKRQQCYETEPASSFA